MQKTPWVSAGIASVLVFAVAVIFRVPSCHESFWIDELHSAWVVADGFADVSSRAAIGSQTCKILIKVISHLSIKGNCSVNVS